MDTESGAGGHSGGQKVRKSAQSSTREMTASSTVSPTSTLHMNDNSRDHRDRFYPDSRYDNRYPDYRYDSRYGPGGYYGPKGGYGGPVNFYDRGYSRGYHPYYSDPWRRNFYDFYYDERAPYYQGGGNYVRDGRAYGERPPYHPYANEYFYRPDRIDPYRFGYSTDKLGRGFGYSCKDVFECQDLKNREEAAREAQRRSYGPPVPYPNQYQPSPAPYHPPSATYRAPYENANLWYPPTPAPSSGRSVTYFPQDRYDPYYGNYYAGGYGVYTAYAPYYSDRYRDYYRGKKK
ncbi:hypothetical protein BIW11_03572 [Tropilaelaps mercedesae]|uniref:Uncharacterized protein n=1 Tax=Tropilaelaps mercedesae TaxID=418985 RepID=A0A1V9XIW8_9ACAR|nr:hypothetical protein BIW11_03572 [Tropilaelaps mercedesae]